MFCRESCVGQLRHIYVCTPEIESLVVSILPKIQPAPVPCPLFLPSNEGPIKLPSNGLWVLRLPYPLQHSINLVVVLSSLSRQVLLVGGMNQPTKLANTG